MSTAEAVHQCEPPRAEPTRERPVRGYAQGKDDYLARLRKVEGQVRGLLRMVEADSYCPDVVIQVTAVTRALQEVAVGLLNDHLRHCVLAGGSSNGSTPDAAFDEVARTLRQVVRL